MISFLSSNRLLALRSRENVTLMGPSSASKRVANLQRKMNLPLISEAEERTASITAVKGEGEGVRGQENNG